ncbi:MAG: IS66 family transposase [Bacteroidota bacterium]
MANPETITISKTEYLQLKDMADRCQLLEYEVKELKRLMFGVKRERFIAQDPSQLSLFVLDETPGTPPQQEKITYTRTKNHKERKHPLRGELPAHLPREEQVIEPENIPQNAQRIGEVVTELLEYDPAKMYVKRYIRPKYIVDSDDERTNIVIAQLPSLPIPKANAASSMLAHITVSKMVDHLPFYRQAKMLRRMGLEIPESTIGGWFSAMCNLLEPLYNNLKQQILATDYLMADETPIPVLTRDKPGATHKGYHWVYYEPVKRLVLFDYRKSRAREGPKEMLENYNGYLQTDGYTAYNNLNNQSKITYLACMAHARRKFEHARDNHPQLAEQALVLFQQLYDIERKAREESLSFQQIHSLRLKESVPVLDTLKQWMDDNVNANPPKNLISKAIAYTLTLWPRLVRYVENGKFQIDNNLIENSIRPLAIGRKNYLFAGSHDAAHNAAIIYSLLGTCKINDIEPYQWLKNTLDRIPNHPQENLHELLPVK